MIMNPFTIQQHNVTFHQFEQNQQNIHFYITWACNFNINNLIIIKFTYPNIALKQEHEFQQLNSQ